MINCCDIIFLKFELFYYYEVMIKVEENISNKPLVLIVDDIVRNLQVLGQLLYSEGYDVAMAESANEVLKITSQVVPDLILLDVSMPGMSGFELSKILKSNKGTRDIPVIFVTARADDNDILAGFESGGVDYITKPFNHKELIARVKTHLELKSARELIEKHASEIDEKNRELTDLNLSKDKYLQIINNELSSAADYVVSLLPKPLNSGLIRTDWRFIPSSQLGGDSFGYHWIDDSNFAIYLLDVCGHGVGPALHSVSIQSVLRFETLQYIDFTKPEHVLDALNSRFQMAQHKELYFSIWYGVYNIATRQLKYSGAGHPPPLLIDKTGMQTKLSTPNYAVGIFPSFPKNSSTVEIEPKTRLYIFSDGAYDIKKPDNTMHSLEDLYSMITDCSAKEGYEIETIYEMILNTCGRKSLDDDFSMLKVSFH